MTLQNTDVVGRGKYIPTHPAQCETQLQQFVSAGSSVSTPVATWEEESSLEKTVYHDWKIYQAGTWGIMSFDKARFVRPNIRSGWIFSEYTHRGDAPVGTSFGGTRDYSIIGAEVTNNWSIAVKIRIDFLVNHHVACDCPVIPNVVNSPFTSYCIIRAGYIEPINE